MATAAKKQDMPPPGGFKPMDYSRVPARTILGGKALILGHFIVTAGSLFLYSLNYKKVEMEELERRSSMFAIMPLLQAERDREYLKQLKRNRDEEANLMKNVDGWVVGMYKGEPVYKTLPPDTLVKPTLLEYYVHSSDKNFRAYNNITMWD
uniref:NADH dehydrogenase [ubiquinone] 1 alpha subcomplex subunit 13 n=1 Tax=Panstrongylus lignarius TaxID=156445 RepID=A0A224XVM8_9HEMI